MGTDRRREIVDAIQSAIEGEKFLGVKVWGPKLKEFDTYELESNGEIIWCAFSDFYKLGENRPSKKIVYISSESNTEDDVLELSLPYVTSPRNNSLVCETEDGIEIRMYGKFRIQKKNYKAEIFMNYLKDNGYSNEVRIDENSKEYVKLLDIDKNLKLDLNNIKERFTKWLNVINDYKEYNFLLQG